MKFPSKLTALAVAVGLSGVASAQISPTQLNVIIFDPTTNNLFDFTNASYSLTSPFTGTVTLSTLSGWSTYVSAEGTNLSHSEFVVFGGSTAKAGTTGSIGYNGTIPVSASQLAAFFGTSGTGALVGFTGTSSETNSSTDVSLITGGLTTDSAGTMVAPSGTNLSVVNYPLGSGTQTHGPVIDTLSFSSGAGTVTFAPEPGTFALMGAGLLAVGAMVRRRTRR